MSCDGQFLTFISMSEEAVMWLTRGHTGQFQEAGHQDLLGLAPRASPTLYSIGSSRVQKSGPTATGKMKQPKSTTEGNLESWSTPLPPGPPAPCLDTFCYSVISSSEHCLYVWICMCEYSWIHFLNVWLFILLKVFLHILPIKLSFLHII